jgi:FkbH-like protein
MSPIELDWLPVVDDWQVRAKRLATSGAAWSELVALANARLDFTRTNRLDEILRRHHQAPPTDAVSGPVRLAILGSSTLQHLHAGIRIGALRRGMWVATYENGYGQYFQDLLDPRSKLHQFKPTAVLFAYDTQHLTAGANAGLRSAEAKTIRDAVCEQMRECWRLAREAFGCQIIQQTLLPALPVLGNNEQRLPGSRAAITERINAWLREAADQFGVELLALDTRVARDGLSAWYDPALWHRSKQEVSPQAGPMYGDLVARLLAAKAGRSFKCLVLDLDNTLWGGVIGDDGLDGIVLGQGSPLGEAHVAMQEYARELSWRGVILAVCSKNDEANALEAFERHPEMVLKRSDIACFKANWNDKAQNLRAIAAEINIGMDSLVFLDDNPAERALVRRELPMVGVPEVGDDPSYYPLALANGGYFEGISVTAEDLERTRQYQANIARGALKASAADMPSYLRSLEMEFIWQRFNAVDLQRIVQLINKTNQFNLTTRRYDENAVRAIMADPRAVGLQLRLVDRFGDNGVIGIIIGRAESEDFVIDTWLMSCRVLGRQVEAATLNLIVEEAKAMGAKRLVGEYRPTKKNGMVKDHYAKLGFAVASNSDEDSRRSILELSDFEPAEVFMTVRNADIPAEGVAGTTPGSDAARELQAVQL